MDARMMRGLQIAQTSRISKNSNYWVVPSQSGNGTYKVKENGHGRIIWPFMGLWGNN